MRIELTNEEYKNPNFHSSRGWTMTEFILKAIPYLVLLSILIQASQCSLRSLLLDEQEFHPNVRHHASLSDGNRISIKFEEFMLLDAVALPQGVTHRDYRLLEEAFLSAYQKSPSCSKDGFQIVDEITIIPNAIVDDDKLSCGRGGKTSPNLSGACLRNVTYLAITRGRCIGCTGEIRLFSDSSTSRSSVPSTLIFDLPLDHQDDPSSNELKANKVVQSVDGEMLSCTDDIEVVSTVRSRRKRAISLQFSSDVVEGVQGDSDGEPRTTHAGCMVLDSTNMENESHMCGGYGPSYTVFINEYNRVFQQLVTSGKGDGNVAGILEVAQMSLDETQ